VDKKLLLVPVQVLTAVFMLALFALVAFDLAQPWHVIVFAALSGTTQTFYITTRQALMPEVVDKKELPSGVALDTSVWQGSRVLAPAIAGPLIGFVGVATCFLFTAIGSLIGGHATARIQTDGSAPSGAGEKGWKAFIAGLEYVRNSVVFSTIIGISLTVTLLGSGFIILLPSFADEVFDNGARGYTIMQLTFGAGALSGTLLMAALAHIQHRGRLLFISTAVLGVLVTAFALSENFPLSLALLSVTGVIYSVYMNCSATLIMVLVPDQIRGRVLAVYSFTWFLLPLGGFVSGSIAAATTTPISVAIGGGLVTAIAVMLAAAVPQVRRL
jgi:MFS family permease